MLSSIQAAVVALFVDAVGLAAAFVPSIGADKQILVAAGTQAIVAAFLIGNAIIHHGVTTAKAISAPPVPAPPVAVRQAQPPTVAP